MPPRRRSRSRSRTDGTGFSGRVEVGAEVAVARGLTLRGTAPLGGLGSDVTDLRGALEPDLPVLSGPRGAQAPRQTRR